MSTDKKIAMFAGTFDPFTLGHASIVERGLAMFDKVIIAIGLNIEKYDERTVDRRLAYLRALYAHDPRIEVMSYTDLTVQAARRVGACVLLRGVRSVKDFEYERQLADVNRRLGGPDTVLLYSLPEYEWLSSSVLRDMSAHGIDITPYLPKTPTTV